MKTKSPLIAVFILLCSITWAQSSQMTIDLSKAKKQTVINFFDLSDKGWLFFTGKDNKISKKLSLNFTMYSPSLKKMWTLPIERKQTNGLATTEIKITDSKVYHIEKIAKAQIALGSLSFSSLNIKSKKSLPFFVTEKQC